MYSVIKAVFSGGFSEVYFHQNSLEMLLLEGGVGGNPAELQDRGGARIDRNHGKGEIHKRNGS